MSNIVLPIDDFKSTIVDVVGDSPVVIITAETGAGKSTRVPQFLLEAGYDLVVTQPRRLAARTVATRVAEEYNTPLGELVGYRTAFERKHSKRTRCLFVTDGLAMVQELMGNLDPEDFRVLVIDEVHEWNLNIEVLVAWAAEQIRNGANFRLVLMSATMEAERLSDFFGGWVPIIDVPGRTFPVVEQAPSGVELEDDVADLLELGHNVLVFQPGKAEIEKCIERLTKRGVDAEILPLHGQLSAEEQALCFNEYSRPKCVVSTNVAQTSVTIPDIDAVVDSGMERRNQVSNYVEGLYLCPISQSDRTQRKGRAGRTRRGVYIDWCPVPVEARPAFAEAEILRRLLEQPALRLTEAGFDMEHLRFFNQPQPGKIQKAFQTLRLLGCMDEQGKVTKIGHLVARLPVSVQSARMIVEAGRLGVADDVITIAAIMEEGELNARTCGPCRQAEYKSCNCWLKLIGEESKSDFLAQLMLYRAAEGMSKPEMIQAGIFAKRFRQAKERRRLLVDALKGQFDLESTGNREDILKSICAGMITNLHAGGGNSYQNADRVFRDLGKQSVVKQARLIVAVPWDLEIPTRDGGTRVLPLLKLASEVRPEWLIDVAPQLIETRTGLRPRYDEITDQIVSSTEVWFNGLLVAYFDVPDEDHPEADFLRRTRYARHPFARSYS